MARALDPRPATKIRETGGPSTLAVGAIPDGKLLQRSGSSLLATAALSFVGQYASAHFTCTVAVDWNNGNCQEITLGNNGQTFTFANPIAGGRYLLKLKQPASGAAGTVTWPGAVVWSAGVAPTLTPTNGKTDIVSFYFDGTSYFGAASLNY